MGGKLRVSMAPGPLSQSVSELLLDLLTCESVSAEPEVSISTGEVCRSNSDDSSPLPVLPLCQGHLLEVLSSLW